MLALASVWKESESWGEEILGLIYGHPFFLAFRRRRHKRHHNWHLRPIYALRQDALQETWGIPHSFFIPSTVVARLAFLSPRTGKWRKSIYVVLFKVFIPLFSKKRPTYDIFSSILFTKKWRQWKNITRHYENMWRLCQKQCIFMSCFFI